MINNNQINDLQIALENAQQMIYNLSKEVSNYTVEQDIENAPQEKTSTFTIKSLEQKNLVKVLSVKSAVKRNGQAVITVTKISTTRERHSTTITKNQTADLIINGSLSSKPPTPRSRKRKSPSPLRESLSRRINRSLKSSATFKGNRHRKK